jgi:hypothetical protein
MENAEVIIEAVDIVEKKKRGRKVNPDAITKDPKYFTNYYHKHLSEQIECPNCNKKISKQKLKRHQQTKRCTPVN